jgi:hypothetical protein
VAVVESLTEARLQYPVPLVGVDKDLSPFGSAAAVSTVGALFFN